MLGLHSAATAAGARCMLMSLWKVDDTATRVLMNVFYQKLAEGNDPPTALKEAQKVVRANTNKGWDDPLFWAAGNYPEKFSDVLLVRQVHCSISLSSTMWSCKKFKIDAE